MAQLIRLDGKDYVALAKRALPAAIDAAFGRKPVVFVQRFREQRVLKRIARGAPTGQ